MLALHIRILILILKFMCTPVHRTPHQMRTILTAAAALAALPGAAGALVTHATVSCSGFDIGAGANGSVACDVVTTSGSAASGGDGGGAGSAGLAAGAGLAEARYSDESLVTSGW